MRNNKSQFLQRLLAKNKKEQKKNFIYNLCENFNPYKQNINTAEIFCNNFRDMFDANTKYADKYFHSKANCQAAQKGYIGGALMFDLGREGLDYLIKNPLKRMSETQNREDCIDDMRANFYGLRWGLRYPNVDCSKMMIYYRPNGLNNKY